jgi:uncharacterized protein (DUF2147 family)
METAMDQRAGVMRKLLSSIVAATVLTAPSAVSAMDIYGVWVRDGHPTDKMEFYDCSGKLCAKGVLPMLDGSPPPLILRSAAKTGPNSWKGDLFNPEDGKTYTGKITYDSQTQLTLTGCLVAFLCQSETWTRVSGPSKASSEKGDAKGGKSSADAAKGQDKAQDKPQDKGPDKAQDKTKEKAGEKASAPAKPATTAKPATPQDAAKAAKPAAKPAPAKKPAPEKVDGEQ